MEEQEQRPQQEQQGGCGSRSVGSAAGARLRSTAGIPASFPLTRPPLRMNDTMMLD